MSDVNTKIIREKYGTVMVSENISTNNPDVLELCDAYDEMMIEHQNIDLLVAESICKDRRIAALEEVVREFIDKCEFIGQYIRSDGEPSQGRCPICYAGSMQGKHKTDCEFFKARAVLEVE